MQRVFTYARRVAVNPQRHQIGFSEHVACVTLFDELRFQLNDLCLWFHVTSFE